MKEVKLEEMKREYEDIPVPEELEFRVRASIERAKLERKKGNAIMTTVKRIVISLGATAAAFMVGVTGLANSSATIAHAMEQIPVLGAITKVVTFRNYEDDRGNTSAHIEVPQIEGGEGVSDLNDAIKAYTDTIIAQYEKDAAAQGDVGHYDLNLTYKVVTDNDKLFALRFDETLVMASGNESVMIYNVDKDTGKIISLSDLFKKDSDYIAVLTENIQSQMREQMAADDSVYYWLEDEVEAWNFKELSKDATFYVNENGQLVIVFNEGEVAPMYMGVCEFTIPSDVTEDIVKSDYLSAFTKTGDPAVSNLNQTIQDYTDAIVAQYEKDAAAQGDEGNYDLNLTYEIVTDTDKLFAIRFDKTIVMNSGNESVKIYNVDKETGKFLTLGDLFKADSDYISVLTANIQSQMRDQMAADDNVYYWLEDEVDAWNFKELSKDATFFVNKDGQLVIVFDEGDVAPMYMGVCEFTIPSDVTKDIAKPGYLG